MAKHRFSPYIRSMKAVVISPKSMNELKFINSLRKKRGIESSTLSKEELEDIGLSKLLKSVDKTKKASRESIAGKLTRK